MSSGGGAEVRGEGFYGINLSDKDLSHPHLDISQIIAFRHAPGASSRSVTTLSRHMQAAIH